MPAAVAGVEVGNRETDPSLGITADELIRLVRWRSCPLTAVELQRWLLRHEYAVLENGMLVPTALGVQVGGSLRPLEGA